MDGIEVVEDGNGKEKVVLRNESQSEKQQEQEPEQEQSQPVADPQDDTSSSSADESDAPQVVEVMEVSLTDAQYANLTAYMSTQLYVSLSFLIVSALILGAVLAQQILNRWGVR